MALDALARSEAERSDLLMRTLRNQQSQMAELQQSVASLLAWKVSADAEIGTLRCQVAELRSNPPGVPSKNGVGGNGGSQ